MDEAIAALARSLRYQIGVDAGYGQNSAPQDSSSDQYQRTTSDVLRAYALARNPFLGLEAGYMKLPEMHTKFSTGDYPAYKLAAQGLSVTYPQTATATQDITASSPYARLNLYGPTVMGAEPYGFLGKALVRTDNHEHAIYNNKDVNDYREVLKQMANYYGLGLEMPLSKDLTLRAEYGRIPNAVDEYHTNRRDISMGTLGLGMKW